MNRKEIDFSKRYWGITYKLAEPELVELQPTSWRETHYPELIDCEYTFWVVGAYPDRFVTLQSYAFFEMYEETLDAYMWLKSKPGRSLFHYKMEVVRDEPPYPDPRTVGYE